MARCKVAIGRYAEISGTGTARIRPVRALVDLAQRIEEVGEGIAPPGKRVRFHVYFIGNPAGGTLDFSVPPVKLR